MARSELDSLTLLLQVGQLFNSTLDLGEVLNLVIDQVIAALRAERGILLLYDEDGQLRVRAARGVDRQTLESPEFEYSRSIVERVAREGEPLLTSDAQDASWLSTRQSVIALGLRSVLCVPLHVKGTRIGVVYVDNRLQAGIFTPEDLELLTTIAGSAATAIENARLYEIAVEKGRMEQELQMARSLQASFIPRATPALEGWDIAARWHPAREVSGDYYDFPPGDRDKLHVIIADVSDKGMAAALFMSLTRATVRASIEGALAPAAAVASANRLLSADAARGMFVSLFYLTLEPASGQVAYVNAGHNPPLLYRAGAAAPETLPRTGMVLGIDDAMEYGQQSLQLAPDDLLLLYTDGVTDALDPAGELFGETRLEQFVAARRDLPSEQILHELMAAIQAFSGGGPPFDDITLVLLKRAGPA
jgi:sigma-B regulation protein RsbU (phosphoserine phosphatase)